MRRVLFAATVLASCGAIGLITGFGTERMAWLAFFFALGMAYLLFLLLFSERFLLRILGATLVDSRIAPELVNLVSASSPATKIAIMPGAPPNALLLKSLSSYLVLTDEALSSFSEEELHAAVARTLSSDHAALATWVGVSGFILGIPGFAFHRDPPSRGAARVLDIALRPFVYLSSLLEGLFFSGALVFEDDKRGALHSGKPDMLARVVLLCEGASRVKNPRKGNPSLSLLFLVPPYRGSLSAPFDFHPAAQKRTSKLNELSKKLGREII